MGARSSRRATPPLSPSFTCGGGAAARDFWRRPLASEPFGFGTPPGGGCGGRRRSPGEGRGGCFGVHARPRSPRKPEIRVPMPGWFRLRRPRRPRDASRGARVRVDGTRCLLRGREVVVGGGVWGGASDPDTCPNPSPALLPASLPRQGPGRDPSCRPIQYVSSRRFRRRLRSRPAGGGRGRPSWDRLGGAGRPPQHAAGVGPGPCLQGEHLLPPRPPPPRPRSPPRPAAETPELA